jgi:hypothetical protein
LHQGQSFFDQNDTCHRTFFIFDASVFLTRPDPQDEDALLPGRERSASPSAPLVNRVRLLAKILIAGLHCPARYFATVPTIGLQCPARGLPFDGLCQSFFGLKA